jgi:hypothetical protein
MEIPVKDKHFIIGFNDGWLRIIGIPLASVLIPVAYFNTLPVESAKTFWIVVGITFLNVLAYWHMDRGIVIFFRKKFPDFAQNRERLIWQFTVILAATIAISYLSSIPIGSLEDWLNSSNLIGYGKPPGTMQIITASLTITITVLAIYESMFAIDMWKISLVEAEKLKKEHVQAQLETLKNQVNPHFLFNSLNTLAAVIPENPEKAVEFVEKLSKVYRYILEIKDKELITLKEEMFCIEAYEFLLKIRFGENIEFEKAITEDSLNNYVVPLSLQMLIENAVKHNIISNKKPLLVKIYAEDDFITISNNLQSKKQVNSSTDTGLKNINARYALLSNRVPEIEKTEDDFIVRLPMIKIGKY